MLSDSFWNTNIKNKKGKKKGGGYGERGKLRKTSNE